MKSYSVLMCHSVTTTSEHCQKEPAMGRPVCTSDQTLAVLADERKDAGVERACIVCPSQLGFMPEVLGHLLWGDGFISVYHSSEPVWVLSVLSTDLTVITDLITIVSWCFGKGGIFVVRSSLCLSFPLRLVRTCREGSEIISSPA